jgi:alkylhydroperoxidase family enzyme
MTGTDVRIPPVPIEALTEAQMGLIGGWHHLVFSRVMVRHPGMYQSFVGHLAELIVRSTLPPRDREIICLRTLRLCDEQYEHTHHITIARQAGMTAAEIAAASAGHGAALTDFDRILASAAEALQRDQHIAESTWQALAQRYTQPQLIELLCLAGCCVTLAMLTKTLGMIAETSDQDLARINALRQAM